jgi:tetratricopeptide (TPR) repeat protein
MGRVILSAKNPRIFAVKRSLLAGAVALFCASPCASALGTRDLQSKLAELRALDQGGRFDEAIRRYRELLRGYPDSTEVRLGLANDLARTDKCQDGSDSTDSAVGQAGVEQELIIGICHFRRNEISAALPHLMKAVDLAPSDRQAAIFLGRAYAESGKPEEGVRVLRALKGGAKDDPDVLYWAGVFYDQLAQRTYDAMAKSHPGAYEVLETQGDQLLQQQKYDEALRAYQEALRAAPDAAGLHFDLGNTYWHMARADEAATELSAELKLNPNHAQANYELGDIAVKQGDSDRGQALLRKALEFDPSLVEAHRSLGRAYIAKQDLAAALREFSIVAKAEPLDHTIHALLASVYQRMGRKQEAQEETRRYNELVKRQMSDLQQKEAEQNRDAQTRPVPQK